MNYALAYRIGFHPWEDSIRNPRYVEQLGKLLAREEKDRAPPFGAALDVGTGSAIWAVELAKRGWQVTGIDNVERALERGRKRVEDAGVDVDLVQADVTRLRHAGLTPGFRLVLDTGTFHGLPREQRSAMAREVDALASADATILMISWTPRRRPVINIDGASREEIEAAFPGWHVTHVEWANFHLPKALDMMLKPEERWYRLRRKSADGEP